MNIVDHRLEPCRFVETENYGLPLESILLLVLHYTAGGSFDGTLAWFQDPSSRVSAHVVIGRAGEVAQCVPFDRQAWHAGRSEWHDTKDLNGHSIGIELDNPGRLSKLEDGKIVTSWGRRVKPVDIFTDSKGLLWHKYTKIQIERAAEVSSLICSEYGIDDIVGHEDIAPGRKSDPGPAWPWPLYRTLMGP